MRFPQSFWRLSERSTLRLTDRTDPITKIVAYKLIELARQGERDPQRLCDLTLQAIQARHGDTGH